MPEEKESDIDSSENSFFVKHEFSLIFCISLLVLSSMFFIFDAEQLYAEMCGDKSSYGSCSTIKPFYCESGFLIEKATVCGCSNLSIADGDTCLSGHKTYLKESKFNYTLNGEKKEIGLDVYHGLVRYIENQSRSISYNNGEEPERLDFEMMILNNEYQRDLLMPLVASIQNQTNDKVDQVRIAISLVQNIPYGFSNKTYTFFNKQINYSRYPYEVLYDNQGVCGEKSELLAFILRELGYDTAILYNQQENHEAVGIRCPREESYKQTGYCFIETTAPAIMSDDRIVFVGGLTLESDPEVIQISNGSSLPHGLPEYRDAEIMKSIRLGEPLFFKKYELDRLREKYGLAEEYRIE